MEISKLLLFLQEVAQSCTSLLPRFFSCIIPVFLLLFLGLSFLQIFYFLAHFFARSPSQNHNLAQNQGYTHLDESLEPLQHQPHRYSDHGLSDDVSNGLNSSSEEDRSRTTETLVPTNVSSELSAVKGADEGLEGAMPRILRPSLSTLKRKSSRKVTFQL